MVVNFGLCPYSWKQRLWQGLKSLILFKNRIDSKVNFLGVSRPPTCLCVFKILPNFRIYNKKFTTLRKRPAITFPKKPLALVNFSQSKMAVESSIWFQTSSCVLRNTKWSLVAKTAEYVQNNFDTWSRTYCSSAQGRQYIFNIGLKHLIFFQIDRKGIFTLLLNSINNFVTMICR